MNADAIAVLRLLVCCHGHAGTTIAAWGDKHADMILLRLEQKGFVAKRRHGNCRRGYYDPTAAGYALLDHDNRTPFDLTSDDDDNQNPGDPSHAEA